jgi:hypothetical protein
MSKIITTILSWIIRGVILAGGLYFGAAAITGRWDNFKTSLRNEGANQCVNSAQEAELKKLKADLVLAKAEVETQKAETKKLEEERDDAKKGSKEAHEKMAKLAQNGTLPDDLVDLINEPVLTEKTTKKKTK